MKKKQKNVNGIPTFQDKEAYQWELGLEQGESIHHRNRRWSGLMICPKCGAKIDGLYLNGCFKCSIKASPGVNKSEKRKDSEKTVQAHLVTISEKQGDR